MKNTQIVVNKNNKGELIFNLLNHFYVVGEKELLILLSLLDLNNHPFYDKKGKIYFLQFKQGIYLQKCMTGGSWTAKDIKDNQGKISVLVDSIKTEGLSWLLRSYLFTLKAAEQFLCAESDDDFWRDCTAKK